MVDFKQTEILYNEKALFDGGVVVGNHKSYSGHWNSIKHCTKEESIFLIKDWTDLKMLLHMEPFRSIWYPCGICGEGQRWAFVLPGILNWPIFFNIPWHVLSTNQQEGFVENLLRGLQWDEQLCHSPPPPQLFQQVPYEYIQGPLGFNRRLD